MRRCDQSDLDETDSILETIRDDDNHMWYLNSVVFPIMLQKYTLENPETLKFIIKNALMHYHVGSLHLYHPMWIFGRMHYWNVLHTYLHDFQLEFENMQLQRMIEEV